MVVFLHLHLSVVRGSGYRCECRALTELHYNGYVARAFANSNLVLLRSYSKARSAKKQSKPFSTSRTQPTGIYMLLFRSILCATLEVCVLLPLPVGTLSTLTASALAIPLFLLWGNAIPTAYLPTMRG